MIGDFLGNPGRQPRLARLSQFYGFIPVSLALLVIAEPANALPSFARQTGDDCAACHIGAFGPQLTPHGMKFKLQGYAEGNQDTLPLSMMALASYTRTRKDQSGDAGPHDGTNDNFSLQELSGFLAGRLTDHLGSFVQTTYSDIDRKLVLDNLEFRYGTDGDIAGHKSIVGLSLNNNPGSQDIFNTMPAWRFPFTGSELAPTPAASTMLEGGLEHQVLGLSGYALVDGSWFGELGMYRSLSHQLLTDLNIDDEAGSISGVAPYWRLAYFKDRHQDAYSVGLFGMNTHLHPGRAGGRTDQYFDMGVDGMYQFLGDRKNIFAINTSFIHEEQTLDATYHAGEAERKNANLNRFDLSGSYFYEKTYGLTLGWFKTSGDRDASRYAPEEDAGSRTGSPDSTGYTLEASWTPFGKEESWNSPWANLRLGLQYTGYTQFNGSSSNYDGFGRDASDNNTLFAYLWMSM